MKKKPVRSPNKGTAAPVFSYKKATVHHAKAHATKRNTHLVQRLLQGGRVGGNLQGFVAGDLAVVDKSNQVIV